MFAVAADLSQFKRLLSGRPSDRAGSQTVIEFLASRASPSNPNIRVRLQCSPLLTLTESSSENATQAGKGRNTEIHLYPTP